MYSVLTEPFISVIPKEGSLPIEVGLRDAFLHAHEYADIGGDNPMERYAQVRFLAAFAMDMLEMKTAADRKAVFQAGRFNTDTFDEYIQRCQKEGASFDLYDAARPFMQTAFPPESKSVKAFARIDICYPAGNAHTFHHSTPSMLGHSVEDEEAVTPPKAFRCLCVKQTFGAYSTEGPAGINGMPMYVYAIGGNLFETILLHTLSEEEALPREYGLGTVPWRKNGLQIKTKDQIETSATLLQALTWMPRRVQFIRSEDGKIRKIFLEKGLHYKETDTQWRDTNTYARNDTKKGTFSNVTLKTVPDKWIYFASIHFASPEYIQKPDCIEKAANVYDPDQPRTARIRMSGIDKNSQSYILYSMHEEEITIPDAFIHNAGYAEEYRKDVALITEVERDIRYFIPKKNKKSQKPSTAETQCLFEYERIAKDILMDRIADYASDMTDEERAHKLEEAVTGAVREVMDYLSIYVGSRSSELIAMEGVRAKVNASLRKRLRERGESSNGSEEPVERE